MKLRTLTVERLPHPEQHGDWHDRPTRWIARSSDPLFTQKFSTKAEATAWKRVASRAATFNEASAQWQALYN